MKTRTFIDCVTVDIQAGKGGDGSASFRREANVPEGGPDGGDGGRGGNVIVRATNNVNSLIALYFDPSVRAEDGIPGRGQRMYGRNGRNEIVKVPCGTEVYNEATGLMVAEVLEEGQEAVLAKGGSGGMGNVHYKTPSHQAPTERTLGEKGEAFRMRFELKTIADAGLIGFPNAGKSSLLTCVSEAHPKIASYPFTTLNPIVGTIHYADFSQLRVADIPGIIEGASQGTGLGIDFLRHIARSRVLVYIVDMAGTDNRAPWDDYRALRREIRQYDASLLKRPTIVLANKMDQAAAVENLPLFIKKTRTKPIALSATSREDPGVVEFKNRLHAIVKPLPLNTPKAALAGSTARRPPATLNRQGEVSATALAKASFFDFSKKTKKNP